MVMTFVEWEENEMKRFEGKAVLVTGAGSGIGAASYVDCIRKVLP